MPRRINKAIELLEQRQPIYCIYAQDISHAGGVALAHTWADMIRVNTEYMTLDLPALDAFVRGLVDGGPTSSGHRTPTLIVELPLEGTDPAEIHANAWMFKQVLARGVHGILLCHAGSPQAVQAFVETCRYPTHAQGIAEGLNPGRRGTFGVALV